MQKELKIRDKKYLKYLGTLKCLIKQNRLSCNQPTAGHHLTFGARRGIGQKASDKDVVPLCKSHHMELHRIGEKTFWLSKGYKIEEVEEIARKLWEEYNGRSI